MRMMVLVVLMAISLNGFAEQYWSVGSFGSEENAFAESQRISSETGLDVEVTRDEAAGLYRLLVMQTVDAAAQKMSIESAGVSPWTFQKTGGEAVAMAPMMDGAADQVSAKRNYFLVLASFAGEAPAEDMADALENDGLAGVFVSASRVDEDTYYRVVQGPHTTKRDAAKTLVADLGYDDAWWVVEYVEEEEEVVAASAPTSDASADTEQDMADDSSDAGKADAMVVDTPVVLVPSIDPPQPGQTFFSYCVQQANQLERAIYCSDTSFNELVVAERRVVDRETALLEFCAIRATAAERGKYCGD
jgi:hypothetical protein